MCDLGGVGYDIFGLGVQPLVSRTNTSRYFTAEKNLPSFVLTRNENAA